MIVCVCRGISEGDIETHLAQNPQSLGKAWAIVSESISGAPPICEDGKGCCTEYATEFMELCDAPKCCP